MKKNILAVAGLAVLVAAPAFADVGFGNYGTKIRYVELERAALQRVGKALTEQERLEQSVQTNQARLTNPIGGTKVHYVRLEKAQAQQDLAVAHARLEAFKTAGPKAAIPQLEQAIRNNETALRHVGIEGKVILRDQRRNELIQELEVNKAALGALKG